MISIMRHLDRLEKIDRNKILKYAVIACIAIAAIQYYLVYEQLKISFQQEKDIAVSMGADGRYRMNIRKGWGVKCSEGKEEIAVKIDRKADRGKVEKIVMEAPRQSAGPISCSQTREVTVFRYLYEKISKK